MEKTKVPFRTTLNLSTMMFLQYMMFAVWWVPLAAYLTKMEVGDMQKSMILSSMAFGCLAAPFVGMLADRYFQGQLVLAFSNLITSVLLLFAGITSDPGVLFICLILAMIFYMPSWGLTSSIAMTHLPTEIFARVRVFGSIGWVVSGGFSIIFIKFFNLGFDGTHFPFFCAAGVGFIAFLSNLLLPTTVPQSKGQPISLIGLLGLRTVKLMKDHNFFWFIILSFLSMIPFSMYWSYGSEFLLDTGFKYISIVLNLGQLFEILFLISVPFVTKKFGIRKTMIFGLIALMLRYIAFLSGSAISNSAFYIFGIIIHGLIFGYFYLGGQMYIDKTAPKELKSEGQGFIFLVTFGLGLILGNFISGQVIRLFSDVSMDERHYNWVSIWGVTSLMSLCLLISFIILFRKENLKKIVNKSR